MTSLADKAILLGADNRPPMLEKDMYDSWKNRTKLYMLNRQHGRMILESVENDPLIWPTVEENGVTRSKKYSELSTTEAIQADCDMTYPVTSPTLDSARSYVMQGTPFTQRTISSIPIGGSISPEVVIVVIVEVVIFVAIIGNCALLPAPLIYGLEFWDSSPMKASISFSVFGTMFGHKTANSLNLLIPGDLVGLLYSNRFGIGIPPGQGILVRLTNPPYELGWKDKEVPTSEGNLITTTERVHETYKNVSQEIRDQLNTEAEAVLIILTGIDNDIYSTVDACPNACEMWKAMERLKHGESINVQYLKTNLYWEFGKFTYQDGESLESYYSRDGENLDKMKEKGDECIFVGYSTQSRAYRVFNKRTRVIMESIHVNFDELPKMASAHNSSDPAPTCQTIASVQISSDLTPECQTMALEHSSLSPGQKCQENVSHEDKTDTTSNELDLLFSPMFDELLNGSSKVVSKSFAVSAADAPTQRQQPTTPLNNPSTPAPTCLNPSIAPTVILVENINQAKPHAENDQVADDEFINIFSTPVQDQGETSSRHVDSLNMHTFYQRYPSEQRWIKDHPLEQVIGNPSHSVRTRRQLESDAEMCMFALTLVEIVRFIVESGCSKHMTGNLKLLINFVEKFLGTVKFGNDQIAPILGYGDLVQGAITIKRVYYVEGLNHNLFSVGQFCDANLEVAFRKSTCFIRDLKGNDLLTGSHGTDLYLITLQNTNSPNPICLMAKATSSQAWLWHRRLSHLNFDTINLLSKNDIVVDLPKVKFVKDHLCSSCELGKAKRKYFHTKLTPSSKRWLQLLHMDLCGPMRVASINGKRYVLVIVDDYSRYTWTHFLGSKDETPEDLIDFLRLVQRGL
nr:retrovirus-related Pol polyprotein from transposon TNT 1-94 [Tanacetum cinerariifolium]